MIFFSTLIIAMFITVVMVPPMQRVAIYFNAVDVPNSRKVHSYPRPRCGGMAMAIATFVSVLIWLHADRQVLCILAASGLLVFFGFVDDVKNMSYRGKFAVQVICALIVTLFGGVKIKTLGMLMPNDMLLPAWIAIPLTVLFILGITNAINLADGLDGLAGGIALLSFVCMGYLAFQSKNTWVLILSAAMIGAIFGFLRFNTYPATLFMGDAGSQFIGFMGAISAISITQNHCAFSPMLPLLIFGLPIIDTLSVMYERISTGRSPFSADMNHMHHKIIRLGLYHTEAVFILYMLQTVFILSAFFFRYYTDGFIILFFLLFAALVVFAFAMAEKKGWQFKRYNLIDKVIKGRLRVLREKKILIKFCFRTVRVGFPILLFAVCMVPSIYPISVSIFALILLAFLTLILIFKKDWLQGAIRVSLYMLVPVIVYLGRTEGMTFLDGFAKFFYLSFGLIVFFAILTLKFSDRKDGFKTTPTDFLVFFIAIVVPNLPDAQIRSYHMGTLTAEIISLLFGYEVLIGELRGEVDMVAWEVMGVLFMVGVRGLL